MASSVPEPQSQFCEKASSWINENICTPLKNRMIQGEAKILELLETRVDDRLAKAAKKIFNDIKEDPRWLALGATTVLAFCVNFSAMPLLFTASAFAGFGLYKRNCEDQEPESSRDRNRQNQEITKATCFNVAAVAASILLPSLGGAVLGTLAAGFVFGNLTYPNWVQPKDAPSLEEAGLSPASSEPTASSQPA